MGPDLFLWFCFQLFFFFWLSEFSGASEYVFIAAWPWNRQLWMSQVDRFKSVGDAGPDSDHCKMARLNLVQNPSNIRLDVPIVNKLLESGCIDLTIIHVEGIVN